MTVMGPESRSLVAVNLASARANDGKSRKKGHVEMMNMVVEVGVMK